MVQPFTVTVLYSLHVVVVLQQYMVTLPNGPLSSSQVLMVELGVGPCDASRHDRRPGLVGGPLPAVWRGPGHCGLPVTHRYLHPDGRPQRGHHTTHQTGRRGTGGRLEYVCILGEWLCVLRDWVCVCSVCQWNYVIL